MLEAQPQAFLQAGPYRKGAAFPQCAVAEPRERTRPKLRALTLLTLRLE
jgi:hypothetical protein